MPLFPGLLAAAKPSGLLSLPSPSPTRPTVPALGSTQRSPPLNVSETIVSQVRNPADVAWQRRTTSPPRMAQESTATLASSGRGTVAPDPATPDDVDEEDVDHPHEVAVVASRSAYGRERQSSYGTTLRSECENEAWTWVGVAKRDSSASFR